MTDQPYQPQQPPDPKRETAVNLGANMMRTGFQQLAATSRNPIFAAAVMQQGEDIANAMREAWHAKEYEEFQNSTGQQFQQSMGTMMDKFNEAISPTEGISLQPKRQTDKDGVFTGQIEGYSEVPTVGLPTGRYNKEGIPLIVPLSDPRSRVIMNKANVEMVKGLSGLTQRYIQAAQQYKHNPAIVNQVAGLIKVQYDWINQLTSGADFANQSQMDAERMDMDRTTFGQEQQMFPSKLREQEAKADEAEQMPELRRAQTAETYASAAERRSSAAESTGLGGNKLLKKIFVGGKIEDWWFNMEKELGTALDTNADMHFTATNGPAKVEREIQKEITEAGYDETREEDAPKIERIRTKLEGARTAEMKFRARATRFVQLFVEASGTAPGQEAEAVKFILTKMDSSGDKVVRKAAQEYRKEVDAREMEQQQQPTAPIPQ